MRATSPEGVAHAHNVYRARQQTAEQAIRARESAAAKRIRKAVKHFAKSKFPEFFGGAK